MKIRLMILLKKYHVCHCTYVPVVIPSKSITAICASPLAVMSPMLSEDRAKDLYLKKKSYRINT